MSNTTTVAPAANAIQIMPAARIKEVQLLSQTAQAASREIIAAGDEQTRAFVIAHAVTAIRSALTNSIMADIMMLANSSLGFKTDRPPGSKTKDGKPMPMYPTEVVRDCMVQALIRGLRMTGNEINIIAGNLYVTKEGYRRLVREFPGLTNLRVQCGVPKKTGEGALVDCKASWEVERIPDEMVCEGAYAIPIRVNAAMGVDAILGKAESKLYRRIYDRLVGSDLALPDVEEAPTAEQVETPTEAA